jgi:hypothetical protein
MGSVFRVYNLAATLAVRRFVATYRRHVLMLGIFVFMVLFTLSMLVRFAISTADTEGPTQVSDGVTPGALATVAFVLLFLRGLVDVHRGVLKDRALWSVLMVPVGEGRVRAGLLLRTLVFQLGLLALVMGTFSVVLLASPEKPRLGWEAGPLIVLAGVAAGTLPLPFLLSLLGWRQRAHRAALALLIALEAAFSLSLQLELDLWVMLVTGVALVVGSVAVTLAGAPVLATAWASFDSQRYRASRYGRRLPPAFSLLSRRKDPLSAALFRREMVLGYPPRQRATYVALNVLMTVGLITVNMELGRAMWEAGYERYFHSLVTPMMVALGIYAVSFFQAAMPLVDGVTREGRSIWVLRASPVKPRLFLSAKARPLLAFLPLTAVCVGLAIPLVAGRGPVAMAVATLGAVAVYLAFMGVGAWAGAAYPSLDRHSNAPPDLVLAFYLMFGCLVLEGLMLFPVLAIANLDPLSGVAAAGFAVFVGFAIMLLGITAGGRVLSRLEVS